jgi:cyanate permease
MRAEALQNRWTILAVLFTVRLTMAFQFQSVAAVAPLLGPAFGVGLADIGTLIGLYFAPGMALALPGGAIGRKFGDKQTVLAALLLMLIGGLGMALSDSWSVQIAGRLISGAGGVMLNVQMTKIVADWFAGKEIATAMAIFVNSWPAGIALSLLALPLIGSDHGIEAVYLAVAALIGAALLLFALTYQPPAKGTSAEATPSVRLDRGAATAVVTAGLIWGLFNIGFAMIFSFGPTMLVERGWSISAAGSVISCALWLGVASVPLGGLLADRSRRPSLVLIAGVRDVDGCAAPQQRGDPHRRRPWHGLWPAGGADDEPARARVEGRDARDRHGHFLYPLLRDNDAGACRRRGACETDREYGDNARLWRRPTAAMPGVVVGI